MEAVLFAAIISTLLVAGASGAKGKNVALTGEVTQSSLYSGSKEGLGVAPHAIDGNQDADYMHGSCTHTELENSPWLKVNLVKTFRIHSIAITGRDAVPERLNGAEIRLGISIENEEKYESCGTVQDIGPGETQTFECGGKSGDYVIVIIPNKIEHLSVCELQVFEEIPNKVKGCKCYQK